MPLRQFLYCDDALMDDFLAQLEGGQTDEVRRREQTEREGRGELGVGAGPLRLGGGGSRGSTEESEAVIRQVRASKFDRLNALLIDGQEIAEIEGTLDEETWNNTRRGTVISIDARVAVPQVARAFAGAGDLSGLLSLMRVIDPASVDAEVEQAIAGIKALSEESGRGGGTLTAVASPPASPYRFIMRLSRKFLLADARDLDGEATVVGKVTRKIGPEDRELTIEIPGMSVLDEDARREMLEEDTGEFSVSGPGAVVVPLAIFR